MRADLINAAFELIGSALCWANVYKLRLDRQVKGVYWAHTAFYSAWGFWNLYFYPSLGQWLSFWAGVIMVSANATWLFQVWRLLRK